MRTWLLAVSALTLVALTSPIAGEKRSTTLIVRVNVVRSCSVSTGAAPQAGGTVSCGTRFGPPVLSTNSTIAVPVSAPTPVVVNNPAMSTPLASNAVVSNGVLNGTPAGNTVASNAVVSNAVVGNPAVSTASVSSAAEAAAVGRTQPDGADQSGEVRELEPERETSVGAQRLGESESAQVPGDAGTGESETVTIRVMTVNF